MSGIFLKMKSTTHILSKSFLYSKVDEILGFLLDCPLEHPKKHKKNQRLSISSGEKKIEPKNFSDHLMENNTIKKPIEKLVMDQTNKRRYEPLFRVKKRQ